tara:strand:- start:152 stop:709 length:558 start_codon:yes stop_codon:yes gene_type:complete
MMITQAELKENLHYNPDTGDFTWIKPGPRRQTGRKVGSSQSGGYRNIRLLGVMYLLHRLAFLYVEGKFPPDQVDHINGMKDDNRWINLRHATNAQNHRNMRSYKGSTSKFVGVSLFKLKRTKKDGTVSVYTRWYAQTNYLGKRKNLGYFKCETCAALAYDDFVSEHYPKFSNTNFPRLKVANGRA